MDKCLQVLPTLLLAVGIAALFTGCANQSMRYAEQNKPLAQQGKIKWSEYYKGLYDAGARSGESGQFLSRANVMISAALAYEGGKLSKDEFESLQRQARASQTIEDDAADVRRRAAFAAAATSFNANSQITRPQLPTQLAIQSAGKTAVSASAAATAYWTGKQNQVQTVTYQSGWNCEYNYAGQTFWRTFVGTCPTSVQVQ
jgi:hypothetical protein